MGAPTCTRARRRPAGGLHHRWICRSAPERARGPHDERSRVPTGFRRRRYVGRCRHPPVRRLRLARHVTASAPTRGLDRSKYFSRQDREMLGRHRPRRAGSRGRRSTTSGPTHRRSSSCTVRGTRCCWSRTHVTSPRRCSRCLDRPVAYAELPGAQHAFDGFQSVRCGSVINGMEWFTAWVRTTHLRVV